MADIETQIENFVTRMTGRISGAAVEFMAACGVRLAKIGALTAGQARDYLFSRKALEDQQNDLAKIKRILSAANKANLNDIDRLCGRIQAEVWDEAGSLLERAGKEALPAGGPARPAAASPILASVRNSYRALADSTAASAVYREAVSGMLSKMTGDEKRINFRQAMRQTIRDLAGKGLYTVGYKSGLRRRLDTSVRSDLMSEFTRVVQGIEGEIAGEIGTDAWEISAHNHSAEDHEPLQGRVFANGEYEKLQNGMPAQDIDGRTFQISRPVGMWNCRHIAYPFMLGVSERAYPQERLDEIKEQNESGIVFRGKHYTLYEAEQMQRQIEARMRRWRERKAVIQEVAGADPAFKMDLAAAKDRIKGLRAEYSIL
ncbi:MAG: phage minor capsid protein, partial [Spirochaetaceae bacterium]|nr:phage minor capsid protein [Spirochaetaceae bacterium]